MGQDLGALDTDLATRLFGGQQQRTSLDLPRESSAETRRIFSQGDGLGRSPMIIPRRPEDMGEGAKKPPSIIPRRPDDMEQPPTSIEGFREKAKVLVCDLAKLLMRSNITASLPAHSQPHIWSTPIDLSARISVPAAVTGNGIVISYQVAPGRWARFDGYGMNDPTGTFTYDGSILWSITVDGVAVPSLTDIAEQRGSIVQPRKTFIIVREGQTIQFAVRRAVAAGAPTTIDMALTGWTWRLRTNAEGTKASVTAF